MESIIVDLNGALLQPRPFDEAHKRWFELMGVLLADEKIKELAFQDDWFDMVDDVMDRFLGDAGREYKTTMARTLFGMVVVGEIRDSDLVEEFAEYLYELKKRYEICLVTTVPDPEPILEKLNISDLFNVVYKSSLDKRPDKVALVKRFLDEHDPKYYIGYGDKDLNGIGDLGIKTVSVSWIKKGLSGDYDAETVKELVSLL